MEYPSKNGYRRIVRPVVTKNMKAEFYRFSVLDKRGKELVTGTASDPLVCVRLSASACVILAEMSERRDFEGAYQLEIDMGELV